MQVEDDEEEVKEVEVLPNNTKDTPIEEDYTMPWLEPKRDRTPASGSAFAAAAASAIQSTALRLCQPQAFLSFISFR